MTKVDKINYSPVGEKLPSEFSDALSALRGFAKSTLNSSVVFSAGLNPRLYGYCESFDDFFPGEKKLPGKKIILKVSDFRSAMIQGKFLAKKGLWISEFRIESGLNCGGHAFATDGLLLGPILEEFKSNKVSLSEELFSMCNDALMAKGKNTYNELPELKISVQGGIGTANEDEFLIHYYKLNSTGWGSPFLLSPEVTNVDDDTLNKLASAKKEDYYLSNASPLGVPFNNFRNSSSEEQRQLRIKKNRHGSPCYLKFLATNTEFTEVPICTASRQYQILKMKQARENQDPGKLFEVESREITEKDCLCEGLSASALLKNKLELSHALKAVAICPGPNLAYFSGIFSLREMVNHIYGRINILNTSQRSHMFINELQLYIDYLKKEIAKTLNSVSVRQKAYLKSFKENLLNGIQYYQAIIPEMKKEAKKFRERMKGELSDAERVLQTIPLY